MDPNNPLRGPRRAARRGEEALRYDRQSPMPTTEGATTAPAAPSYSVSATATPPSLPPPNGSRHSFGPPDAPPQHNFRGERDHTDHDDSWAIPYGEGQSSEEDDNEDEADEEDDDEDNDRIHTGGLMAHMQRMRGGQPSTGRMARGPRVAVSAEQARAMEIERQQREAQRERERQAMEAYEGESEEVDDDVTEEEEEEDDEDEDEGMEDGSPDEYEFAGHGEEDEEGEEGDEEEGEEGAIDVDDEAVITFDPMLLGLKEINNLAHFSVSSHKPGNGVDELLADDLTKYWQSDGPQPHFLTIHFLRRVEIRAIRFYVDYNQDESYTPTSVVLSAGTGHHDLLEFASLQLTTPVGWQEIDLSHVGGGADGQSLCCWIVQVKVKENHQNGKDTHIRGIGIYAIDENAPPADQALDELARVKTMPFHHQRNYAASAGLFIGPDAMADKDGYLFERLITQPPDRLPGAPERSGSMATFLRDEEIR